MTVYLIINKSTDAVATARVFASADLAWAALDATASWIASPEKLREQFGVAEVAVEEQPVGPYGPGTLDVEVK